MKFLLHPNFPTVAAPLLQAFDATSDIYEFPFPTATDDLEWIGVVAKYRPRPTILGFSCLMIENQVQRLTLRESKCSFVHLTDTWQSYGWPTLAWRLVKAWPAIVAEVESLTKQSTIEVTINGKCHRYAL